MLFTIMGYDDNYQVFTLASIVRLLSESAIT